MVDKFQWSEFSLDEGQNTASDYFESLHSPSIGYTHIKKSVASIEAGLDDFEDESERLDARVYANVTVFREAMQYVEEFGIYLYSRLDPEVDFVDAITGTRPDQVKELFDRLRDGQVDQLVNEYTEDPSGDEWLKRQLGYTVLEENDATLTDLGGDQDIDVESVGEAIEKSLAAVRANLSEIAAFFLKFDEAYNAIKHGTRVIPTPNFKSRFDLEDESTDISVDEPFVTFLCKTSGEKRGGWLYTFTVPVRILREQAVAKAGLTNNLYTQIHHVIQANRRSLATGEKENFQINFYGVQSGSGDSKSHEMLNIGNPDSVVWVPKEAVPDHLQDTTGETIGKLAVSMRLRGVDLVIETRGDRKRSYEYPILIEASVGVDERELMGRLLQQNFTFQIWQLPLWQYLELVDLKQAGPFDSVKHEFADEGKSGTSHPQTPVEIPDIVEPDRRDELEFMIRVGKATETPVMTPAYWYDETVKIIQRHINAELTKERAERVLSEIEDATDDEIATRATVSILDPSEKTEDRYPVINHSELGVLSGGVILEIDEAGGGNFQIIPGSDPRYDRGGLGDITGVGACFSKMSPYELFEVFTGNGVKAIEDVDPTVVEDEANAIIEYKREYGPRYTWYTMDSFHISIYEAIPPHLEAVLPEDT